jgi:hypothetical protein
LTVGVVPYRFLELSLLPLLAIREQGDANADWNGEEAEIGRGKNQNFWGLPYMSGREIGEGKREIDARGGRLGREGERSTRAG